MTITLRKLAARVNVVDQGQQSSIPFQMASNVHWERCCHSHSEIWKALLICNVFSRSLKTEFCGEILLLTFARFRSSRSQMFFKKYVLKNFAIFTGKYLCWSFFLKMFIKKRPQHRCFSCEYWEIFKNRFFYRTL